MLDDTRLMRRFVRHIRRRAAPMETTLAILRAEQEALSDGILIVDPSGRVLTHNSRLLAMWGAPSQTLTRESEFLDIARNVVSEPDQFKADFHRISSEPKFAAENELVDLNDGRILARTTLPVSLDDEKVAGRIWYFRDVTTSARAEQLQNALFRIAEISRSARDLHELFGSLHRIVGELMDATNFYIALIDEESGMLDFPYFVDEIDGIPPRITASGLTGYVLRTGESLLANPSTVEDMVARGLVEDIGAPSVDWLGVPLKSGRKSIGVLVVQSYRESVRFTLRHQEILVFVSQHIAAAIEQKRREAALRESENRYRQMFKNNQAIKLVVDPEDGLIVDANPAACSFYGWTADELRRKHLWEISTIPREVGEANLKLASEERQGYFTSRHRLSNGDVRDIEVHSGPIEVRGRKLVYSIIHDITERNRAEKLLRRSEEHFRSLIENASDMIAIVDVQGTLHYASPSVERVLGYKPQSITGSNIYDCAHPEDLGAVAKALTEAFEGITSDASVEIRIRHRDGTWRTLEGMTHRLERESGERLVVNSRDVTDRKQTEVILHTHSAALEASMDGIAIINGRNEFNYVNHAFIKLFGYRNRSELIGEHFTIVLPSSADSQVTKEILPAFLKNGEWRGESVGQRRDGSSFPLEISMTGIGTGSAVCVIRDITERQAAEDQIKHLAYHDALTALPNRLLFQDRLMVALSHAQRDGRKLAVLFLDLDRFKVINDSMGHDAGDALLQQVSDRLKTCVRESDTVSRMGGDEFTVLLTNIHSAEDATKITKKILEAMRRPFTVGAREVYTSTSVGISLYPNDGDTAEVLLKSADMAMYHAKEHGRNTYKLSNQAAQEGATERMHLENELRRALDNHEFVLHYQPICDVKTGHCRGMEALIRWQHPEKGLRPPADFLQVAESTGLMGRIGEWCLERACTDTAALHAKGYTDLTVNVNLSMSQLQHPDLVDQVRRTLESTGLPAENLELEIPENGVMLRPEATVDSLQKLHKLGVRIALDDFGVGQSSMSLLKRLPLTTLKIDQSFVREITEDPENAPLVTFMVQMGHHRRLSVVAEGVEQEAERDFLVGNGCDQMQGFLIQHPAGIAVIEQLLESQRS